MARGCLLVLCILAAVAIVFATEIEEKKSDETLATAEGRYYGHGGYHLGIGYPYYGGYRGYYGGRYGGYGHYGHGGYGYPGLGLGIGFGLGIGGYGGHGYGHFGIYG